jgi:hypothetical protein
MDTVLQRIKWMMRAGKHFRKKGLSYQSGCQYDYAAAMIKMLYEMQRLGIISLTPLVLMKMHLIEEDLQGKRWL